MTIDITQLRAASTRTSMKFATSINEAKSRFIKTAFLCHSHLDRNLAEGLQVLLQNSGIKLYIDWQDSEMPARPNRVTASRIKEKIVQTEFFFYLATENSSSSRWCPWEIGYADGTKNINKILVVPVKDGGKIYGAEYLDLYRRIDISSVGNVGIWSPGRDTSGLAETL